jgi:hypothetical protein
MINENKKFSLFSDYVNCDSKNPVILEKQIFNFKELIILPYNLLTGIDRNQYLCVNRWLHNQQN